MEYAEQIVDNQLYSWKQWCILCDASDIYLWSPGITMQLVMSANGWFDFEVDGDYSRMFSAGRVSKSEPDRNGIPVNTKRKLQCVEKGQSHSIMTSPSCPKISVGNWSFSSDRLGQLLIKNGSCIEQCTILREDFSGFIFHPVDKSRQDLVFKTCTSQDPQTFDNVNVRKGRKEKIQKGKGDTAIAQRKRPRYGRFSQANQPDKKETPSRTCNRKKPEPTGRYDNRETLSTTNQQKKSVLANKHKTRVTPSRVLTSKRMSSKAPKSVSQQDTQVTSSRGRKRNESRETKEQDTNAATHISNTCKRNLSEIITRAKIIELKSLESGRRQETKTSKRKTSAQSNQHHTPGARKSKTPVLASQCETKSRVNKRKSSKPASQPKTKMTLTRACKRKKTI